ncbi:uncharacterized protein [Palaemon carinicauda]|uniref:uncharacterized protein n=1 Tax=Palaemon carinicauda TaxID=392227 RepID=UPI0035B5E9B4
MKQPLTMRYDLNIVNGKPNAGNLNPFEYHFSFDKQDTVEIYLVCVVFYGFVLVPLQVYAACRQIHPITRLFTATLIVQLAGLLFDTLHLLVFSFDGEGSEGENILGDLFNILAQGVKTWWQLTGLKTTPRTLQASIMQYRPFRYCV